MSNYMYNITAANSINSCSECEKTINDILLNENYLKSLNDRCINKILDILKTHEPNIDLILDEEVKIKLLNRI
ncbi:hypothetical protein MseVgp168 [Melanoplus sanguinipes entomopoxvirus]|uniref:Uncharacterized protein n=1 Tax=Melanoplus sanguinipes entomopoxvirus TaxID=83191 RepID=Q9YVS4_MSEPV|nr:hypothetical protein MseVgp168 [Melanoplus sanguinipes entomopoxvirus]AAC97776.1 ORF MSV168 hypothetical protein [Melanoplus sanguinipes entomopoxvirus 'O']